MGNQQATTFKPISRVSANRKIPLIERPPVIGAFYDVCQAPWSGIIIVTANRIENFNAKNGNLQYSVVVPAPSKQRSLATVPFKILCCDFVNKCCLGTCVITGCSDGRVRIYDATNLVLLKELPEVSGVSEKESANPAYDTGTTVDFFPQIPASAIICPLNNTIICGYDNGKVQSFFIETGKVALTYSLDGDDSTNRAFEQGGDSDVGRVDHFNAGSWKDSAGVNALSFCSSKKYVVVGYKRGMILSKVTDLPQTSSGSVNSSMEENSVVNVAIFKLESKGLIKTFVGPKCAILSVHLAEVLTYVVACSTRQLLVWNFSSSELMLVKDFYKEVPTVYPHHSCISACICPNYRSAFVSFSSGSLACIFIYLPDDSKAWGDLMFPIGMNGLLDGGGSGIHGLSQGTYLHNTSELNRYSCSCQTVRLFRLCEEDLEGVQLLDASIRSLWLCKSTGTIVAGDGISRSRLIPIFSVPI